MNSINASKETQISLFLVSSPARVLLLTKAYTEPCQTSKMEYFAKILNGKMLHLRSDKVLNTALINVQRYVCFKS